MSGLKVETLKREFVVDGVRVPDPNPDFTLDQVRDFLAAAYPEIQTAALSGPEAAGSVLRYSFARSIGTKG